MKRTGPGPIAVVLLALTTSAARSQDGQADACIGWVRTTDGREVQGTLAPAALTLTVAGTAREVALRDVLSLHCAAPASALEAARIDAGLKAIAGADFKAAEAAAAELTDIGLPVLTPLLRSFVDTDAHEPDPRYRLFARIVPGCADQADRALDLVRLVDGGTLRGRWTPVDLHLRAADGATTTVPAAAVRRLAIRRDVVERRFELHALHDCTYVGWVDTGIVTTAASTLRADATGFVRLSFDEDGWATDPDGIKEPLPGNRRLQEGFRWGAVVGRIGVAGERWCAGRHVEKADAGAGELYFAVNDNEHWQNNIGSYRVALRATAAFDVGDAQ